MSKKNNLATRRRAHEFDLQREKAAKEERAKKLQAKKSKMKLKQQILQRRVSSSCSSNLPRQLTRRCQSSPENMSYVDPLGLQLGQSQLAPSETVSAASTEEGTSKGEPHIWTHEETEHLLKELALKGSQYTKCKSSFSKQVASEMNGIFKPNVDLNKFKVRSRLDIVRNQWKRKQEGRQLSKSVPVSLLNKYSGPISELLTDESSSSSVQLDTEMHQDQWTNETIIAHLVANKVHAKRIARFKKALEKNRVYATLFHHYEDIGRQLCFLEEISSKKKV